MRKKNNELYNKILEEIRNNNMVTEVIIANKYLINERTVRRYIKELRNSNKIILIGTGKNRYWKIL